MISFAVLHIYNVHVDEFYANTTTRSDQEVIKKRCRATRSQSMSIHQQLTTSSIAHNG